MMISFAPKSVWRKKSIWFSLIVMLVFTTLSALAPWLAPHDPYQIVPTRRFLPPMWVHETSAQGMPEYPLGTDTYGRDILSRLLYGTRTALFLALTAVPLAALIGTVIGLLSGFAGGKLDDLVSLLIESIQSLPGIMFLVIIVLIFRYRLNPSWLSGCLTLIIGFAAVSWVSLARLVRINTLQLKSQLFIEAAVSIGASPKRILFRHLLPNVRHIILVWIINNVPAVILLEVILGYIGVGLTGAVDGGEFTAVSWGGMFFSGRTALSHNPWMLIIPSLCLLLISMSFILLADHLNDAFWEGGA